MDARQIHELHIGDEDAQHIDLDHRPGRQTLDQAEDLGQEGRRPAHPDAEQDVDRAADLDQGRQDGGGDHRRGQEIHAAVEQLDRAGDEIGRLQLPLDIEGHEGQAIGDDDKDQPAEAEGQRPVEPGGIVMPDQPPAALAYRAAAVAQRGQPVEPSAASAFDDSGGRERQGARGRVLFRAAAAGGR